MTLVAVLNAISTWGMVGVIWMVQLVHYPLFAGVGTERWVAYERAHQSGMLLVVGPLMLTEALTSAALALTPPGWMRAWEAWAGVGTVALAWGVTAFVSVPLHGQLAQGWDEAAHRVLVSSNWLRTLAWTAHAALVATWLLRALARA